MICRIHQSAMTEYVGLNGRQGEGPWFCGACERGEGVPVVEYSLDSGCDPKPVPLTWTTREGHVLEFEAHGRPRDITTRDLTPIVSRVDDELRASLRGHKVKVLYDDHTWIAHLPGKRIITYPRPQP